MFLSMMFYIFVVSRLALRSTMIWIKRKQNYALFVKIVLFKLLQEVEKILYIKLSPDLASLYPVFTLISQNLQVNSVCHDI